MNNIKTILIKIIILIAILFLSNYIYVHTLLETDIQTHSEVINKVRSVVNDSCEVVYVAESSNITTRGDDVDKRPISSFIADYFPNRKVGTITKEASHAGIYYELLRNIPESSSIKTVVVTLNLRSFDANWIYSDLETPLQKSIVLLKDRPALLNRFLLAFKGYDVKTNWEREKQYKNEWKHKKLVFPYKTRYENVSDWDRGLFDEGIKNSDGSKNWALTELACHYVKTYAFQIDTASNPRIKDFDNIVKLAKKRKWNLMFNLMAENMEMADSLIGKELVFLIEQNRNLLVERYKKQGVVVIDNLNTIHNEEFIDQNWTTEHYAEKGRRIIAANVANYLKQLYPNDYVKPTVISNKIDNFSNDCEGAIIWGQMQSLTNEQAFSGAKSSKTGQSQEYGITFEYGVHSLPDSLTQLSFSAKLFQKQIDKEVKLVLEVSGNSMQPYWYGIPVGELLKKENEWGDINYTFKLPANFYAGSQVKVYIYNPTNTLVYIDDLKLKFY